ncbi:MAG TPA: BBE domain-containing protein [Solirubrobacteraceae bacterium]|nr:BBE domain-containing protein [Solirubrobacteraceae bacterium]
MRNERERAEPVRDLDSFTEALARPWDAGRTYLNFAETRRDPHTLWTETAHDRLGRIKATIDPDNLIRSNHPVH